MFESNLVNLTAQYQQVYLAYCYKIMQYLSLLAWIQRQQRPPKHKVKPKSASGVKKLSQRSNQEKPTFKSLKHQEKPSVSTIVAMGFPNGAMSAAFRVAFNEVAVGDKSKPQANQFSLRVKDADPDNFNEADLIDKGISTLINSSNGEVKIWTGSQFITVTKDNKNVLINNDEFGKFNFSFNLNVNEDSRTVEISNFKGDIKGLAGLPKKITITSGNDGIVKTKVKLPFKLFYLKPFVNKEFK